MNPFPLSADIDINLQKLIETRMLLQANSGGGKSWAIRRILEQTHGQVQQIVIDVEDEFYTLREQYDYVLVRREEGDCVPEVRSAGLLARRLLELGVSAIISIYEMKHHERISFVKAFLDAMVNAPKSLWHPVLVVVDEAHIFCPESSKAESAGSVIDLMTRGRKRGFCGILATQRISKLNKDAGAEANNKLIGRAAIDVDMKRAGDELGFTKKEDQLSLRTLKPGQVYGFGPAISDIVIPIMVGPVKTTHPKAGAAQVPIAPPKQKVLPLLSKLGDLPKEAHEELVTIDQFRRELTNTRRELTLAKNAQPKMPEPKVEVREVSILTDADRKGMRDVHSSHLEVMQFLDRATEKLVAQSDVLALIVQRIENVSPLRQPSAVTPRALPHNENRTRAAVANGAPTPAAGLSLAPTGGASPSGGMKRMMIALAQRPGLSARQLGVRAGLSSSSGTFGTYLAKLRTNGWLDGDRNSMQLTADGTAALGNYDPLPAGADLYQYWRNELGGGAGRMLEVLYEAYPQALDKATLGERASISHTSGTFGTYLARLRTLELVEGKQELKASAEFFE
jgi:hypothetical protein